MSKNGNNNFLSFSSNFFPSLRSCKTSKKKGFNQGGERVERGSGERVRIKREAGNRTRHDDNLALQALQVLVIDEDFRHLGGVYERVCVVICLFCGRLGDDEGKMSVVSLRNTQ